MTRNTFMKAVMVAIVAMMGMNANAQHRGDREMHFDGREMRMHDAPRGGMAHEHRGGYMNESRHRDMPHQNMYHDHHHDRMVPPPPAPRFDRYGYLPGWEGRVRYMDGRYGYLRGSDWYWYDTYYEPGYYFAHPIAHFHHHHLTRGERAVVHAVAGAAIIGGIISALAH